MGQAKRRREWVGALTCALLMAGCTGNGSAGSASPSGSATVTVTESAAPSTAPAPSASEAAPSASAPVEPTPTPEATEEERVVLDGEGLGIARFGDAPEDVIEALNGRYGSPDRDSDWVPAASGQFGACPGTVARGVYYGQLFVLLTDGETPYGPEGQRHLTFYQVTVEGEDPAAEYGDGPQTVEGIGVGSTVADLQAAFGGGVVTQEDERLGPLYTVSDAAGAELLSGSLTDTSEAGVVTAVSAGQGCGE